MSLETRSSSALFKRAEQLKRWEQSETNRETTKVRQVTRKIKFSSDCVFLAACAAADKDEVLRLLQKGADINAGNVDGLTALHQACIDDNMDMVEFLVEHGADIDRCDNEGWTPLHATVSCGFLSIAKYLIEQGCNLATVNNDGELALDIAKEESEEMEELLLQHINKAGIDCDRARSEEERLMLKDARAWQSGAPGKDSMHPRSGATALHVAAAKGYIKVINILLQARCDVNARDHDGWTPLHGAAHWGQLETCRLLVENFCDMDVKNYAGQTAFDVADRNMEEELQELKKKQELLRKEVQIINKQGPKKRVSANKENFVIDQEDIEKYNEETPNKVIKVDIQPDKGESSIETPNDIGTENRERLSINSLTSSNTEDNRKLYVADHVNDEPEVVLRRTFNFETDEKKEDTLFNLEFPKVSEGNNILSSMVRNTSLLALPQLPSNCTASITSSIPVNQIRRSYVPPIRDEESETQRKAHAKRVRETRRSTQGVTLDEIKSAEQLVKKTQQQSNELLISVMGSTTQPASSANNTATITATITTATPTMVSANKTTEENNFSERRPSWRLRVDSGSKFQLEDACNNSSDITTAYIKRPVTGVTIPRPSSAPVENITTSTTETTITLPLRRPSKQADDKDQDKENDSRNAQATQAVIQRRRRPKRRSTGVVHVDMDEIDPEKQEMAINIDGINLKNTDNENGQEHSGPSRRLDLEQSATLSAEVSMLKKSLPLENGDLDYKKLYEESELENERLREKLRRSDAQLKDAESMLVNVPDSQNKPTFSEIEKREKRAMERKLSEMEEELKIMETLKNENQRLKDENGALIRVISKLSK